MSVGFLSVGFLRRTKRLLDKTIFLAYYFAVFPLFMLMGELISASGLVSTLFDAAQAWFGRLKGGLGMAVTGMGAVVGAVTGSAVAACSMMTRACFPEMVKLKYEPAATAGLLAAVAPLAVLIPPSVILCFYGVITHESISRLLIAGFLPGLLATAVYMVLIYIMAARSPKKWPLSERSFTWRERMGTTKNIAPVVLMMLIVVGGIYGGVFTPSEAGAAGSVIALIFVLVLQRRKSGQLALAAVWETAGTVAMLFFILIGSMLYARFLAATGASAQIISLIGGIPVSPYITFAMIVLLYVILGCFVDDISMLAITLPITHPLMITLGFDPIWFGIIAVVLVGIATITPPFGLLVFAVKGLVGEQAELWPIFMSALPFLLAMIVVIILLTIWPQIALFLPSMMG